jgi:sulfoxide reductase catalytic subunit YedY
MLIRHRNQGFEHPLGSEITPQTQYLQRRDFLQTLAMGAAGAALAGWAGRDAWAATERGSLPPSRASPASLPAP